MARRRAECRRVRRVEGCQRSPSRGSRSTRQRPSARTSRQRSPSWTDSAHPPAAVGDEERRRGRWRARARRAWVFLRSPTTRRAVLKAIGELSRDREASIRALKLGPKQHSEVDRNRAIRRSPTMPAIDLYSGVLYDAFDARTLSVRLSRSGRTRWSRCTLRSSVSSVPATPFRPIGSPSIRGSPGTTLKRALGDRRSRRHSNGRGGADRRPAVGRLRRRSARCRPLRSSIYVRVLARDDSGRVRALNHFNKQAKGLFARAIVASGAEFGDASELRRLGCGRRLRGRAERPRVRTRRCPR